MSKKEKRHKLISYFPMQTARHHCWPSVNENKTQRLPPWLCISFQHFWSLNDWLLIFSLGRNNMEVQKMIDPVDNHLCICYWKKVRCANSQKVVKMWSQSCRKNVLKLSHKCLKVVAKMSLSCLKVVWNVGRLKWVLQKNKWALQERDCKNNICITIPL